MTPVAPRIVNDVSNVTRMKQANHFLWQVQYLVKFNREDETCESFCMSGAVFGEVGGFLLLCAL